MNNKADKNANTFIYHGWTKNFDECLKTGWYTFGLETGFGYGVLTVQNSSNQEHNNIDNWIWQERRNTNAQYQRRHKINSSPWTEWVDF